MINLDDFAGHHPAVISMQADLATLIVTSYGPWLLGVTGAPSQIRGVWR